MSDLPGTQTPAPLGVGLAIDVADDGQGGSAWVRLHIGTPNTNTIVLLTMEQAMQAAEQLPTGLRAAALEVKRKRHGGLSIATADQLPKTPR